MRALLAVVCLAALLSGCFQTDPLALRSGTGGIQGHLQETQDTGDKQQGTPPPVVGANVLLFRLGALVAETTTDEKGDFLFKNLRPQGYELLAGGEAYDATSIAVLVTAGNYTVVQVEAHPLEA